MTRMRFVLLDPKKADEKAIEEIPCVKGTFTQAGQYQAIIGNDVAVFYNEFTAYAGIEGVSKDAVKAAAKTNQKPIQKIMGALGEIFAPLIPALICGGLMSPFGWIFAGVFGLFYAPVVMTGLHHMTNAIDSQLINLYEGTILWPMIALSNIAQPKPSPAQRIPAS